MLGAAFCVDENRIGELTGQGGFSNAFRAVDDDFLAGGNKSSGDLHLKYSFLPGGRLRCR